MQASNQQHIQSNLVSSKSSGLEDLFRIISSLILREVDVKIYSPQYYYYMDCF